MTIITLFVNSYADTQDIMQNNQMVRRSLLKKNRNLWSQCQMKGFCVRWIQKRDRQIGISGQPEIMAEFIV